MINTRSIMSPLRYPGSKRGLVKYIYQTLSINSLRPSLYIEPFIGGGNVAINLLHLNLVEKALLIDIDPWISSFWKTVFFDTEWIIHQILSMRISLEEWYSYKNSNPRSIRDQAITCLYLNRTSFSGILERRAGPLGGKNQESKYPIDCRFNDSTRKTLIQRIEQISMHRDKVLGIWNCSWDEAIKRIRNMQDQGKILKSKLFFYLDPPFFEQADALYRYYFKEEDHIALRDFLVTLNDKWLLSYDSAEQVQTLYGNVLKDKNNGTQRHDIELLYTVAKVSSRKISKEIIISNMEKLPTNASSDSTIEE